jgi:hypothetical protein
MPLVEKKLEFHKQGLSANDLALIEVLSRPITAIDIQVNHLIRWEKD